MVIYEDIGESRIGIELVRAYSDKEMKIVRDGILYDEAIDPKSAGRVYNETEIPIGGETEDDDTEAYAEAGRILMGVTE